VAAAFVSNDEPTPGSDARHAEQSPATAHKMFAYLITRYPREATAAIVPQLVAGTDGSGFHLDRSVY